MSPIKDVHPDQRTITIEAHKINMATNGMPRVANTKEKGVGHHTYKLKRLDTYHNRQGLCKTCLCLSLRSSTVIGMGLESKDGPLPPRQAKSPNQSQPSLESITR